MQFATELDSIVVGDPESGSASVNADAASTRSLIILHRCDRFVARTMNWLYDHLVSAPRHRHLVASNLLENRTEFPLLEATQVATHTKCRALWFRFTGRDVDPFISRRLGRCAPRILHSHFAYVAVDDLGLWRSLGAPWVVSFYGADAYQLGRLAGWKEKYSLLFEAASKILALGPLMAARIEQLGCQREKIQVHPLGVAIGDIPERPRRWNSGQPLKVLFAGTYREKKGIAYAVQAVAMARSEGVPVEFHLVAEASNKPGDAETEASALQLIDELGLSGIVIRYPLLAFRELLDLAVHCHVFVGPSVTAADGDAEGTPFVLQQMMASAMPVIATQHSDIPYLFGDLSSLLVPERDASAIAARLIQYASNPELLTEHGRLLRTRISEAFDVRDCASKLCRLYDSVG